MFNETQSFQYQLPLQQQMWKDDFQFLTLLSTKLQNTLAPNPSKKQVQLVYNSDRDEITDSNKFLKKPNSEVLS